MAIGTRGCSAGLHSGGNLALGARYLAQRRNIFGSPLKTTPAPRVLATTRRRAGVGSSPRAAVGGGMPRRPRQAGTTVGVNKGFQPSGGGGEGKNAKKKDGEPKKQRGGAELVPGELGLVVEEERVPNSRVILHITVPAATCRKAYDSVLASLYETTKVPGFRKGSKTPPDVLVNAVGRQEVTSSVLQKLLDAAMVDALQSLESRGIRESEHVLTKGDVLMSSFDPDKPLSFDIAVDVIPEIRWVSDDAYKTKALSITAEYDGPAAVATAAENELRKRRKDAGVLRVVVGRPVQQGDVVIIDISARRIEEGGEEGEKILAATQNGFQLDTEEEAFLLPGFLEAILGMETGQTKDFDLVFPETWVQEPLRGVPARFTAVLKEVFVRDMPDLTDDNAPRLYEGCTTIDEVRAKLQSDAEERAQSEKRSNVQQAIVDVLGKLFTAEVPNSLLEETGRNLYSTYLIELQMRGQVNPGIIQQLSTPEVVRNWLVSRKDHVTKITADSLAVDDIVKREGLEVSEVDLDIEVANTEAEFERQGIMDYDKARLREQAVEVLQGMKVIEFIEEHITVNYVER